MNTKKLQDKCHAHIKFGMSILTSATNCFCCIILKTSNIVKSVFSAIQCLHKRYNETKKDKESRNTIYLWKKRFFVIFETMDNLISNRFTEWLWNVHKRITTTIITLCNPVLWNSEGFDHNWSWTSVRMIVLTIIRLLLIIFIWK